MDEIDLDDLLVSYGFTTYNVFILHFHTSFEITLSIPEIVVIYFTNGKSRLHIFHFTFELCAKALKQCNDTEKLIEKTKK